MRPLWRGILLLAFFWITPASAQTWMSADCTIQNGEKIAVFVMQGQAKISYNNEKPHIAFPTYEDGVMSVVHIGATASLVLSMTIRTGRAYAILATDRGQRHEYHAVCKIDSGKR